MSAHKDMVWFNGAACLEQCLSHSHAKKGFAVWYEGFSRHLLHSMNAQMINRIRAKELGKFADPLLPVSLQPLGK